jgi:hypothetical protein
LTVPGINAVEHNEVLTAELLLLEYGAYQTETDIARVNTCMSPGVLIPAEVTQSGVKAMHFKIHKLKYLYIFRATNQSNVLYSIS